MRDALTEAGITDNYRQERLINNLRESAGMTAAQRIDSLMKAGATSEEAKMIANILGLNKA